MSPSKPPSDPPSWTPRRSGGGARTELTERVIVRAPGGFETMGWTLNVSRGGLRAIVEERLRDDVDYELLVGDTQTARRASLVWSQDETDGQIVGMKYLDEPGSVPPEPPRTEER